MRQLCVLATTVLLCTWDFAKAGTVDLAEWSTATWYAQNDDVMGGRSDGVLRVSSAGAKFSGNINLRGGGFASFRRNFAEKNLGGYAGLWVEVDVLGGAPADPPLALNIQLGDASQSPDFSAAMAVPHGVSDPSTYAVFLPFEWFTKQVLWSCTDCSLNTQRINELSVYVLYQEGPFSFTVRNIHAVESQGDIPNQQGRGLVPVMTMTDLEVATVVAHTVNRGTFLWSQGYNALCGAVYNSTALTIASSTGPADSIVLAAQAATAQAAPFNANLDDDSSWIYRRAFDHILAAYTGEDPPSAQSYPEAAQGDWLTAAMANGGQVPLQELPAASHAAAPATASWTAAAVAGALVLLRLRQ